MDKDTIKLSVKRVMTDRSYLFLMGAVVFVGLIYVLVTGFSVRPSDITVYSRYSSFGEAHFYKNHWQYLLTFVLFGFVVTVAHVALMVKLHNIERRQTGAIVGTIGIVLLIVALVYAMAVMSLGRAA